MLRRLILGGLALSVALFGLLSAPISKPAAAADARKRILFFNRSAGFEHSVVKVKDGQPCYAETVLRPLVEAKGYELISTKDGTIFTADNIAKFDVFLFYTTGDLTADGAKDGSKPMSAEGKAAFLKAIEDGKGFVGLHCATDTFHSAGAHNWDNQPIDQRDPYIKMIGGEFISHGAQQPSRMIPPGSTFPGFGQVGSGFEMHEEWYSLKNISDDMHVLLITDTQGMKGAQYERPPYPGTWARKHGKGRVFYSSMGHREDVWTTPVFQSVLMGGISWAAGLTDFDAQPNVKQATPEADKNPAAPPPTEKKPAEKKTDKKKK